MFQEQSVTPSLRNELTQAAMPKSEAVALEEKGLEELNIPIAREQILVIAKMSKLEWDMKQTGLSEAELVARYNTQGTGSEKIFSSYLRQKQVVDDLKNEFTAEQIISVEEYQSEKFANYKLIVALGGDDHFKKITHLIDDDRPILGVNSDPSTSTGALLSTNAAELPAVISALERGDYRLEPWSRIRISVDGKDYGPAVNEIVLGKVDFRLTSRHILELDGEKVTHKSSGILISTGAGSTGWFSSAGLYLSTEPRIFEKSADYARFELREPTVTFEETALGRKVIFPPLVEGVLKQGSTLKIISLNNSEGIATRDSIDTIPFERGSVAEIALDAKPLWVIVPKGDLQ
jgi:hypothetical protein